ncbi:HNH endonuclease, partial [Microbulbifer sp. 2205BS26-8]|uniref:HNH endonuclease n=1 Tax=Microbulbifer sp. 2205BS26-8 TaxID=3064386 RepID=UPI00273DFC40
MKGTCFLCCQNDRALTVEHIISQAIGGFLKDKIYCADCNNICGRGIDSAISTEFGRFATLMDINRERGTNQDFPIYDNRSGIKLRYSDNSITRYDPVVRKSNSDTVDNIIQVKAGSESRLNKIIEGLSSKHNIPINNFQTEKKEMP